MTLLNDAPLPPTSSCCGAGTAADTEFTTNFISANIELHKLSMGRKVRKINVLETVGVSYVVNIFVFYSLGWQPL